MKMKNCLIRVSATLVLYALSGGGDVSRLGASGFEPLPGKAYSKVNNFYPLHEWKTPRVEDLEADLKNVQDGAKDRLEAIDAAIQNAKDRAESIRRIGEANGNASFKKIYDALALQMERRLDRSMEIDISVDRKVIDSPSKTTLLLENAIAYLKANGHRVAQVGSPEQLEFWEKYYFDLNRIKARFRHIAERYSNGAQVSKGSADIDSYLTINSNCKLGGSTQFDLVGITMISFDGVDPMIDGIQCLNANDPRDQKVLLKMLTGPLTIDCPHRREKPKYAYDRGTHTLTAPIHVIDEGTMSSDGGDVKILELMRKELGN